MYPKVCSQGDCVNGPVLSSYGYAQVVIQWASVSYQGIDKYNTSVEISLNETSSFNTTILESGLPVWNQSFSTNLIYHTTRIEFKLNYVGYPLIPGGGYIPIRELINRGLNGKELKFEFSDEYHFIIVTITWTHE